MSEQDEPEVAGGRGREDTGAGVEADSPPMGRIFGLVAGLVVVVALIVVGLWQLFKQTIRSEIHEKELSLESRELAEVRARDEERLKGYAVVDEERGFHQIPIERAMERLLRRPGLIRDMPLAKPQPASQPAQPAKNPPKQATPPPGETKGGKTAPTDQKEREGKEGSGG
jgi:FtsZ-interacting cell division protein ZipA